MPFFFWFWCRKANIPVPRPSHACSVVCIPPPIPSPVPRFLFSSCIVNILPDLSVTGLAVLNDIYHRDALDPSHSAYENDTSNVQKWALSKFHAELTFCMDGDDSNVGELLLGFCRCVCYVANTAMTQNENIYGLDVKIQNFILHVLLKKMRMEQPQADATDGVIRSWIERWNNLDIFVTCLTTLTSYFDASIFISEISSLPLFSPNIAAAGGEPTIKDDILLHLYSVYLPISPYYPCHHPKKRIDTIMLRVPTCTAAFEEMMKNPKENQVELVDYAATLFMNGQEIHKELKAVVDGSQWASLFTTNPA